jgi:hypothetical protein
LGTVIRYIEAKNDFPNMPPRWGWIFFCDGYSTKMSRRWRWASAFAGALNWLLAAP